ncbi:hypothetical protein [Streptomyces shenzhenensis]|uniref:hypothetical protein n=1 Tax=Streptomyces shenzhenensis TaxID=943815 RepID=UPI0036CC5AE4
MMQCPPLTYSKWWDAAATVVERREKLITWGVKVYVSTGGVRFEYGEEFPASVQMTGLRFDGARRPPTPGTVSVVVDFDAGKAELVTYGGQAATLPLPLGTQALALAA